MEETKYPTDLEFLELLKVAREEISPEKAPITREWVESLIVENGGIYSVGGAVTAKRLALSLIGVFNRFEHVYGPRKTHLS